MGKFFCRVPQPFSPESTRVTCGTSWLNHSLVAAVAMDLSKIFFSDRQKREADHLVSETADCFVYERDKKGRINPRISVIYAARRVRMKDAAFFTGLEQRLCRWTMSDTRRDERRRRWRKAT